MYIFPFYSSDKKVKIWKIYYIEILYLRFIQWFANFVCTYIFFVYYIYMYNKIHMGFRWLLRFLYHLLKYKSNFNETDISLEKFWNMKTEIYNGFLSIYLFLISELRVKFAFYSKSRYFLLEITKLNILSSVTFKYNLEMEALCIACVYIQYILKNNVYSKTEISFDRYLDLLFIYTMIFT